MTDCQIAALIPVWWLGGYIFAKWAWRLSGLPELSAPKALLLYIFTLIAGPLVGVIWLLCHVTEIHQEWKASRGRKL